MIACLDIIFEFSPRCLTIGATRRRTEKVEAATRTATETGTEIETEGGDTDTEDHQPSPQAAKETDEDEDTDRMRAALCAPEGHLHSLETQMHARILLERRNDLSCGFSIAVAASTIAPPTCGRSTEGTAKGTDAWIPAEIETATERGSPTEDHPRLTTNGTSHQTCTTTGVAVKGSESGMSLTGGRAAGVSTNEGGVEQGPIADPPR